MSNNSRGDGGGNCTEKLEEALQCFIDTMNKEMEGKIVVDEFGGRWRFHKGRWWAMCRVEPIDFEQRLRDNPMPTKTVSDEEGWK